jgi:hypothetical protein
MLPRSASATNTAACNEYPIHSRKVSLPQCTQNASVTETTRKGLGHSLREVVLFGIARQIRQRQHGQRPHGRIRVPCEELVSHTGEMIEAHPRYIRLCFPEPPPCFGIGLYAMTERKEAFSSEKLFCTQFP